MSRQKKFGELLTKFKTSQASTMQYAGELAMISLEEFEDSGNLNFVKIFHDAMHVNYARRSAFLAWMKEFSPFIVVEKEFKKDHGETDEETGEFRKPQEFDLKKAAEKHFWDFSPPVEQVFFSGNDVVVKLQRVVKVLRGNNHKPITEKATAMLNLADTAISMLKAGTLEDVIDADNTNSDETPDETPVEQPEAVEAKEATG